MSEYLHVEKPFLDQLKALGWTVIDQGQGIPAELREHLSTGASGVNMVMVHKFIERVKPRPDAD